MRCFILCTLSNVWMSISRKVREVTDLPYMGRQGNAFKTLVRKPKGRELMDGREGKTNQNKRNK
jgi:hypothetical protein